MTVSDSKDILLNSDSEQDSDNNTVPVSPSKGKWYILCVSYPLSSSDLNISHGVRNDKEVS